MRRQITTLGAQAIRRIADDGAQCSANHGTQLGGWITHAIESAELEGCCLLVIE